MKTRVNKLFITMVVVLFGWLLASSPAMAALMNEPPLDRQSHIIILDAEYLFVPRGFDDNDNIQVVLDGWLDNTCQVPIEPLVNVDPQSGLIEVLPRAVVRYDVACSQVLHRYSSVANIGILPQGLYEVYSNDYIPIKLLEVEEATSAGPDEENYAQIDHVYVDFFPARKDESRWELVMEGRFNAPCQDFDFIELRDDGDTLVVLPVLNEAAEVCIPGEERFVRSILLPDYEDKGRYLVHVRSAGGKAVNEVFSTFDYFSN